VLNKKEFCDFSKTEKKKYREYIPIISKRLNKIHELNKKDEYWEKVLGFSFLIHIAQSIFVYNKKKDIAIRKKKRTHEIKTPLNEQEYREFYLNSNVGKSYLEIQLANVPLDIKLSTRADQIKGYRFNKKKTLSQMFYEIIIRIFKKLIKPKILINQAWWSLSSRQKIQFQSFFKIHFEFISFDNIKINSIDNMMRNTISSVDNMNDGFDKFFFQSLKFSLPVSVLEGFKFRQNQAKNFLKKNKKLKYIFNESLSENANLLSAVGNERGILNYYIEHNYLQHQFLGNNIWYVKTKFDYFLSMGWKDSQDPNHIPTSSNYEWIIKPAKEKTIDILYISALAQKGFPHFSSGYGEGGDRNAKSYIKMKEDFFHNLDQKIIESIYYRDYPEQKRKTEHAINRKFNRYLKSTGVFYDDSEQNRSQELLSKSKFVICDYLSTPYNSVLMSNIPAIILFNTKTYYLLDEYIDFYDDLINANIMFTNSVKASNFVNKIFFSIDKWWNTVEVQNARKKYLKRNFGPKDAINNYILSLL
tara:strand:+ start:25540 stop:27129 length:1590 start_codon:yes stop_codon:yes gene_type:complete